VTKEKNILEFWKLCEIIDFERFYLSKEKIETVSKKIENCTNTKKLTNEFAYKKLTNSNTDIKFKTTNIYKVYYGLIKSEDLIKYIYSVLKSKDEISNNEAIEKELEKLKSTDYTYLASGFTNSNFYPVSIDGTVLSINPIFFVLHQIINNKSFSNEELTQFQEDINSLFCEKFNLDQSIPTDIYIPDLDYLLNLSMYAKNGKTIFDFLPFDVETSICLMDKEYITKLKKSSSDNSVKTLEDIMSLLDCEDNNTLFLHEFDNSLSILDNAIVIADTNKNANIHLVTKNKISLNDQSYKISSNLFLHTFIKKDEFKLGKTVTSKKPLNTDIGNTIFETLIKFLALRKEVFYSENSNYCFAKIIENQQINNIENVLNLNMTSFYIEALKEEPKKLTHKYIKGEQNRLDVNSNIDIRKDINKLEYFSNVNAKWISPHPLYYAQQNAINIFISDLNKKQENLLSINGAPGTGKTTLLKDIISNITTKKILDCKYLDYKIFNSKGLLDSKLCSKYEIIVTSNNNAAVENITKELPQQKEINFEYLDFNPEDFLLYEAAQKFYNKSDCYTLITTTLGNSTNIKNFKTNFESMLKHIELNPVSSTVLNNKQDELNDNLELLFKELKTEEETFTRLIDIQKHYNELAAKELNFKQIKNEITSVNENINKSVEEFEHIKRSIESNHEEMSLKKEELTIIQKELKSFGFFFKLFKGKQYKDIQSQEILVEKNILEHKKIERDYKQKVADAEKQINDYKSNLASLSNKLLDVKNQIRSLQAIIKEIEVEKESLEYNICDDNFFSKEEKELQLSSLYAKDSYLKIKAEVFKISLQLNEILFIKNIEQFSSQILFYINNITKKDMTTQELEQFKNGFSCLSFVFPVVSTSLASSYKMFKKIDSFGTLLCDESGQATPQSLVGLLNRANNALIVGDPLQVEPVFTAPEVLVQILAEKYNISKIHSPLTSSAQQVADNANCYGSYYKVNNENAWVGMPLVVHRRCVEPMFSISNEISYNNKMVLATPSLNANDELSYLPVSSWINVESNNSDFIQNTSTKELKALNDFVSKYNIKSYYLVSPFKSIYKAIEIKDDSVGTVHTFQGKETDVVFILLGGNTATNSKSWVSSKPNILNVAVTRAKKRIYIIGDKNIWKKHNYFQNTINILDQ
jgi:hypothetical protein